MTLVSHDHRFIFLKTQKTAGTATEMALEPFCAPPGHKAEHYTDALISDHGIIGARRLGVGTEDENWFGHQPAADIRDALGADVFDRYTKLTVLRNPFDKIVSWFHWKRDKSGKKLAGESRADTIQSFRRFIRQAHRGGALQRFAQVDWDVCSIDGDLAVDWVLRTETIQQDMIYFAQCRGLNLRKLKMKKPKTAARAKDKIPVPDYYGKVTADAVRESFEWVFEAGDYSLRPDDAARATRQLVTVMAAE